MQGLGLCQCGCGAKTNVAPGTDASKGWTKGEPLRFIRGHAARKHHFEYEEVDNGHATPCWNWLGSVRGGPRDQYGIIYVNNRVHGAHRWSYEVAYGSIPDGLEVDHLCRNTLCVNPDHLEAVARAENARRGDNAKLSAEQVNEIRARQGERSTRAAANDLAPEYGVTPGCIRDILSRRTWRDI